MAYRKQLRTVTGTTSPTFRCRLRRRFAALAICSLLATPLAATDHTLPTIGGLGGGLISEQQEAEIGRQVMGSIRRSAPRIQDPLVADYLESMVHRLLPSVPLGDKQLTLVLIDSPDINAFAVPGNIVGVNGGLFLYARSEQQFGSVIAHELAHLSQRHFARRLEQQETNAPLAIAGMVTGIILSAVTKSDVGLAAIAGTQALSIQNMLQYSRAHEQEADRIGLDIMADAGFDPRGMPAMFETMMRQNRLQGNQPPEYLSTHPLTQSRVSDTRSRAEQYPITQVADRLEYHLVRARLQAHYATTPEHGVAFFERRTANTAISESPADHYGLAVAYLGNRQPAEAESTLRQLLSHQPGRITYQVTLAEALLAQDRASEANALMHEALDRNPENTPITDMLARTELADGNARAASGYLRTLIRQYPERENLWLRLAEAEGQARNIVGVHEARAEYAILMGDLESAHRQLLEAQEKAPPGTPSYQSLSSRLNEVSQALAKRRR
ncbi:MAG: M48 family metalloprotease [Pseudomonadales bacterium]|nr:M48 family metalloprotease [Pseudomonadales bacterium]